MDRNKTIVFSAHRGCTQYDKNIRFGSATSRRLWSARVTGITVYKPCFSVPLVGTTKLTKVCDNSLKWRSHSRLILLVSAYWYFFYSSPRDKDRLFPPVTLRQVRAIRLAQRINVGARGDPFAGYPVIVVALPSVSHKTSKAVAVGATAMFRKYCANVKLCYYSSRKFYSASLLCQRVYRSKLLR